jgi:diadenosine tetraphosphate (Ap4A) HIT family hydrolase/GNAT superfamily N-acetyltransferase
MNAIDYLVRPVVDEAALIDLFEAARPGPRADGYQKVLQRSFSWICAYDRNRLVAFVNLAWDGGGHVFLVDTTVHPAWQRRGIGSELLRRAVAVARTSGADWLHVDFEHRLHGFYTRAGFRSTAAGLVRLKDPDGPAAPVRARPPGTCAFCGVVDGTNPHSIVCEDGATIAFMALRQQREGHVLVIPRSHIENVFDLDDATSAALMAATVRVARAVRDAYWPEGMHLWQSNGPAAEQEVPHFHMHVLPRWQDDGLGWRQDTPPLYPRHDELDRQAARIRRSLSAAR